MLCAYIQFAVYSAPSVIYAGIVGMAVYHPHCIGCKTKANHAAVVEVALIQIRIVLPEIVYYSMMFFVGNELQVAKRIIIFIVSIDVFPEI